MKVEPKKNLKESFLPVGWNSIFVERLGPVKGGLGEVKWCPEKNAAVEAKFLRV